MGNGILQVRAYVEEMLRITRAMLAPLTAQLHISESDPFSEGRWILERMLRTLNMHAEELAEHLRRLGSQAPPDNGKPAFYAQNRSESLRDHYLRLRLAQAGALMLESNARALGYSSTAALATRHREEIASLLETFRELVPGSVRGELPVENGSVAPDNRAAAARSRPEMPRG